jgi:hypothetical protein
MLQGQGVYVTLGKTGTAVINSRDVYVRDKLALPEIKSLGDPVTAQSGTARLVVFPYAAEWDIKDPCPPTVREKVVEEVRIRRSTFAEPTTDNPNNGILTRVGTLKDPLPSGAKYRIVAFDAPATSYYTDKTPGRPATPSNFEFAVRARMCLENNGKEVPNSVLGWSYLIKIKDGKVVEVRFAT